VPGHEEEDPVVDARQAALFEHLVGPGDDRAQREVHQFPRVVEFALALRAPLAGHGGFSLFPVPAVWSTGCLVNLLDIMAEAHYRCN
jgi:hypothetical protein